MATTIDFQLLAREVVNALGGAENIRSVVHCATRLRFALADSSRADLKKVQAVPGVLTVVYAGGQHQVVVGNDVPLAYNAVVALPGMGSKGGKETEAPASKSGKKNPLDAFVDIISSIFTPVLWALAGIALGKAFLSMSVQFGLLNQETTEYVVLNAAVDGLFTFLPLFLAVTAARRFRANEFIAMAVVAPLLHPDLVTLMSSKESLSFLGLPLTPMSYASSVIPAIASVWALSYLQRGLEKILPSALRNFMVPVLCVVIMVPLVLLTIGPLTMLLANAISQGLLAVFQAAPWLAGAILGGFWQVLVIFGLHWGLVPVMLNDIATVGYSTIMAPLLPAVLAQCAAVLAVAIRTKDAKRRKLAAPAAFSGFFAGVTEPIIYGVNLPLKVPFIIGCVSGAIGGAIVGIGGNAQDAFVFPSLLAFSASMTVGSVYTQIFASGLSIALAFIGTFIALPSVERKEALAAENQTELSDMAQAIETGGTVPVLLPVEGIVIPLEQVADPVFSGGTMGIGTAIQPSSNEFVAPVSGKVVSAPKSGHAFGIRTADGIEVLVHIGIDTVKLKGEHFSPQVHQGDEVTQGQPLATADLQAITEAGFDTTTILVVTNAAKFAAVRVPEPSGASAIRGEAGLLITL
ncbi:beta-glucoside-specific PTS transporter subunit IIABC [Corynebacterium freiburgense]|uniref:beta-glucoside-specific PTS transporter subunit IIABC n=1 Tax=Corynebacterium freiburgense TaxID=556548 RepID=UPI000425956E|nr:beta-glucoside-specific PTS transporter subunit IIABC [Corynebacterium freiburgense]WJZ03449.1 PTS system beta-glucoside-specific EIIBCA component [Corynebacterium freiburgense]